MFIIDSYDTTESPKKLSFSNVLVISLVAVTKPLTRNTLKGGKGDFVSQCDEERTLMGGSIAAGV